MSNSGKYNNPQKYNSTNKECCAKIQKYILNAIDSEPYDVTTTTEAEKITFLKETFYTEYIHNNNRHVSDQINFTEWTQGLPTVFNIEYYYKEIKDILFSWGITPAKEWHDSKASTYFYGVIYREFKRMCKRNGIDL